MIEVLGVGADGVAGLAPAARALLDAAQVVVGGERHLAMLEPRDGRELRPWPSPLRDGLPGLLAELDGRRVVVLASGDPLVSGVGTTLVELLGPDAVRIHPAVSSVALARAEMRWSAEESDVVTLVGRDVDALRAALAPRARLVVLTSGADGPSRVASLLVEEGYAAGLVTLLGDLGGPAESRRAARAGTWDLAESDVPRLHLLCIECPGPGDLSRAPGSRAAGLSSAAYLNDGQLTKRIVRAAAIAHLAPQPGDVMWDLGAGAGSVGIEFARMHPRNRVWAVERDTARAERIRENARRLGVPSLVVVEGASAEVLDDLPGPDAVFVGGGASLELVVRAWERLAPGGRLVVHGVTVETEALLHEARSRFGGSMSRIAVEDLEPVGRLSGWRPQRAIVQWSTTKENQ